VRALNGVCDVQRSGSHMKRLALFTDGTHNDTWQCNSYYDTLYRFLAEVCRQWYILSFRKKLYILLAEYPLALWSSGYSARPM